MSKIIAMFAGVMSMLQAVFQIFFAGLSIAQYYCAVDFLRENRELVLIKILYFMNTETCGTALRIGNVFDGMANQAFIIFNRQPFTSTRTFIFSIANLALGCIWVIASGMLLGGGARMNSYSKSFRWAWVTTTICVSVVDVVTSLLYANDSFHTKTLQDIMTYIGATVSGVGGVAIDTSATSWIMFGIHSRGLAVLIMNIALIVIVALQSYNHNDENDVQANQQQPTIPQITVTESPEPRSPSPSSLVETQDNERPNKDMPRAYLSPAFQHMKKTLIRNTTMCRTPHAAAMLHEQVPWTYIPAESVNEDIRALPLCLRKSMPTPRVLRRQNKIDDDLN